MSQKVIKMPKKPEPKHPFADVEMSEEEALIEESIEATQEILQRLGVEASKVSGGLDKNEAQLLREGVAVLENAAKMMGIGFQQGIDGKIAPNLDNIINSLAYFMASTYVGGAVTSGSPLSMKALLAMMDRLTTVFVGLSALIAKGMKEGQK